ncbi:MAG: DUF3995 domain-containing protein [Rhizobiaceae bacterium]
MSGLISLFIPVTLLPVSGLHLAWALGSTFPAEDEKDLARAVTGFRGMDRMPPRAASALVALATFICALWPFAMTGNLLTVLPAWMATLGGIVLALIFSARGIAGYTSRWRALTPEQPFARLDRQFYSPLCLALGLSFFILTIGRFS